MSYTGKLRGAEYLFKNGRIHYFRKGSSYMRAYQEKNGRFRHIYCISKRHITDQLRNIYDQHIYTEQPDIYMASWKILQIRQEDSDEFERIRTHLGIEKCNFFRLLLETYKYHHQEEFSDDQQEANYEGVPGGAQERF